MNPTPHNHFLQKGTFRAVLYSPLGRGNDLPTLYILQQEHRNHPVFRVEHYKMLTVDFSGRRGDQLAFLARRLESYEVGSIGHPG